MFRLPSEVLPFIFSFSLCHTLPGSYILVCPHLSCSLPIIIFIIIDCSVCIAVCQCHLLRTHVLECICTGRTVDLLIDLSSRYSACEAVCVCFFGFALPFIKLSISLSLIFPLQVPCLQQFLFFLPCFYSDCLQDYTL